MQNVTARVISQSLNISLGSFSYHFPDKRIIVKSLYHNLQTELQNMYSSMRNEPASITTYLETHKQLFKIQSKYKFFYLNLFEILLNNEELKEDFSRKTTEERVLARQMLEYYRQQGILSKTMTKTNIERIINVGQILNNFWALDANLSLNKNLGLPYYMEICCGLLEPYLENSSLLKYKEYFKQLKG